MVPAQLQLWDYVSLSTLVLLSTIVGIYQIFSAQKSKVTKDFLVSSKQLGVCPLIISTVATFFSAVGMLGFPMEFYMNGISFAVNPFAALVCLPFGAFLYMPVFYKLNKNTIFEYLELRFCKSIRTFTSLLLSLQMIWFTSVVLYAPSLALNQVTGLNMWASVISIGILCIIYTSLGGIKAVVWADVTQYAVMMSVYILITIKGAMNLGGLDVVWERLQTGNRSQLIIWSSSPYSQYSIWTVLIGNSVHCFCVLTLNQALMQRYLSNDSLKKAQISYIGGGIGVWICQLVLGSGAFIMYATYHDCDPYLAGRVKYYDQLMALFSVETLSFAKSLSGVYIAGIMCATLSTMSSSLNSLTAITMSDYVKQIKPNLSDRTTLNLSRILVVTYGIICIAFVAIAEKMGGIMKSIFVTLGITGGPILSVFTVGMLFPWVKSKAAIWGMILSMVIPVWAWIGNMMTSPYIAHAPGSISNCANYTHLANFTTSVKENSPLMEFYSLSSLWYPSWSLATGFIVTIVVSKFTGYENLKNMNPDLYFPFISRLIERKQQKKENKKLYFTSTRKTILELIKTDEPDSIDDYVNRSLIMYRDVN